MEQSVTCVKSNTMEQSDGIDEDDIIDTGTSEEPMVAIQQNNTIEKGDTMDQNDITEARVTMEQSNTNKQSLIVEQNGTVEQSDTMEQSPTEENNVTLNQCIIKDQFDIPKESMEQSVTYSQGEQNDTIEKKYVNDNGTAETRPTMELNDTYKQYPSTKQDLTTRQSHTMEQNGTVKHVYTDQSVSREENLTLVECIAKNKTENMVQMETIVQDDTIEQSDTIKHEQIDTIKENVATEQTVTMEIKNTTVESDNLQINNNLKHYVPMEMLTIEKSEQEIKLPQETVQEELFKSRSLQEMQYPNPYVALERDNLLTCEICKKSFLEYYNKEYKSSSCKPCLVILSIIQQAHLDKELDWSSMQLAQHFKNSYVQLDRVRIYECNLCRNGFLDYNAFKRHQKKYLNNRYKPASADDSNKLDKPYKCEYCDWSFVMRSTLETHSILHKPFPHECDCGVGYYKKCDLDSHRRLVHPNAPRKPTISKFKAEIPIKRRKRNYSKDADNSEHTAKNQNNDNNDDSVKIQNTANNDDSTSTKIGPRLRATLTFRQTKKKRTKPTEKRIKLEPLEQDSLGMYKCPHCPKTFNDSGNTRKHIRNHSGSIENEHKCDECPRAFRYRATLLAHKERHAGIKRYNCSVCDKKFFAKKDVEIHMRVHTKEKPYACELCPKKFTQKGTHKLHMLRHTGDKNHVCEVCSSTFFTQDALVRHKRIHTGEKPYKCEHCGKSFSDPSACRRHKVLHTGVKAHRCLECPQAFADPSSLFRHKKIHAGYSVSCHLCGKDYKNHSGLYVHLKVHHSTTGSMYECDLCCKRFKLKQSLGFHMKTHYPDSINCGVCGKTFTSKHYLQTHIQRVHVKDFKYKCEICGLKYLHRSTMINHIDRVHSKNKELNHECDYCHKSFYTKFDVQKHIVYKHLGIRCEECDKRFNTTHSLRRHKSEGCIQCAVCLKKFSWKKKMLNHFTMRHMPKCEQQMHECEFCCKQFPIEEHLRKHVTYVHNKVKHVCDHCSTTVYSRPAIVDHIWEKHMISPYCNICLKRFYSEKEYLEHRGTCVVVVKKKIVCEICDKTFLTQSSLREHMLWHGPKRFQCDICGVKYNSRSCIQRHIKKAHS